MWTRCPRLVHHVKLVQQQNTLIPLSRKSMVGPCLFICWRNLISEWLCVALAFSGIIIMCRAWPRHKPSEPRRKPLLVPGTSPYIHALSLQVTGDFSLLCLGLRPSSLCMCELMCMWFRNAEKPQDGFAGGCLMNKQIEEQITTKN